MILWVKDATRATTCASLPTLLKAARAAALSAAPRAASTSVTYAGSTGRVWRNTGGTWWLRDHNDRKQTRWDGIRASRCLQRWLQNATCAASRAERQALGVASSATALAAHVRTADAAVGDARLAGRVRVMCVRTMCVDTSCEDQDDGQEKGEGRGGR